MEEVTRREEGEGARGEGEYRGERESGGGVCAVRGWLGTRGRLGGVSMVTGITGRGGLAHEGEPLVSPPYPFLSLCLSLSPSRIWFSSLSRRGKLLILQR